MRDFLVELQTEYEQIAHTQIGRLEPGLSADEVVSASVKIAEDLKVYRQRTDKLLQENLYPILENISQISDEDEAELFAVAQMLSSYAERIDPGLGLMIYQKLLERARRNKNEEKIVQYLYWCGITMFYFQRTRTAGIDDDDKILSYFEEGAEFADRYDSFSNPETRKYIHRCLGNRSMMYYNVGLPQKAVDSEETTFGFWNKLLFEGKDLDFPWVNYFITCLNHRHSYLVRGAHNEPDSESKATLREVLDIAITINRLYNKNSGIFTVFGGTRYDFLLWEARFLNDLISFDLLYENIYKRKEECAPDDFSSDALYIKFQLNSYLMFYAAKMQKMRDRKDEIISKVSKDALEHFSMIPMSVSSSKVSEQLQFFARNLSDVFAPVEQLDFVLKMTTFRHIPTYAHSIVVGKIAAYLASYLVKTNPDCFIGCIGLKDADEVRRRVDELCQAAETSGLCHDIGKISFVSNPFTYARVLTEEESEIVKMHPHDGAQMFKREDNSVIHSGYIDVIMGHHKYYDNSEGYPEDFDTGKSDFKIIIDIISVANSIEAATNAASRTYADAKTPEEIFAEVIEMAGNRYSPIVAATLDDEVVRQAITHLLDTGRKDAYYKAYLHAWSAEGGSDE